MDRLEHICFLPDDIERAIIQGEEPIWIDEEGTQYFCFCQIATAHLGNIKRYLIEHPILLEDLPMFDVNGTFTSFQSMVDYEIRRRVKDLF